LAGSSFGRRPEIGYVNNITFNQGVVGSNPTRLTNPSAETIIKICLALAYYSKDMYLSDVESLMNSTGRTIKIQS
jgi:hypothetical protein